MSTRRNWLEPAVRAYLVCAVGTLAVGSLLGVIWLKLIGGLLLGLALVIVVVASVYLFAVGRIKTPPRGGAIPPTAAREICESE